MHLAGQLRDARIDHNQCKNRFESKLIKINSFPTAEDHLITFDVGSLCANFCQAFQNKPLFCAGGGEEDFCTNWWLGKTKVHLSSWWWNFMWCWLWGWQLFTITSATIVTIITTHLTGDSSPPPPSTSSPLLKAHHLCITLCAGWTKKPSKAS